MLQGTDSRIELIVLDFEGVCTPTHGELLAMGWDSPEMPIRPLAVSLVEDGIGSGMQIAVLSNEILPGWAETVPLLSMVDHVINCGDNKIFKPDRRAFQRCCLVAGVAAEATLVVDDDVDNVRVASSLGMKAELFDTDNPAASWARVRDHVGL